MEWVPEIRHFVFAVLFLFISSVSSSMTHNLENVASRSLRRLYGDNAPGPTSGRLRIEMPVVPPFVRILRKEYRRLGATESTMIMVEEEISDTGSDWNATTTSTTLRERYGDLELGFEYPDGGELAEYVDYYGVMDLANETTPFPTLTVDDVLPSPRTNETIPSVSNDDGVETTTPTVVPVLEDENPTTDPDIDDVPPVLVDIVDSNGTSPTEIETESSNDEDEEITLDNPSADSNSKDNDTTPTSRVPKLLFDHEVKGNGSDTGAISDVSTTATTTAATPSVFLSDIPIPVPTVTVMKDTAGNKKMLPVAGNKWRPNKTVVNEGSTRRNSTGNGGGFFQSILNVAREKTKLINSTFTQLASVFLGIIPGSRKSNQDRGQHFS